MSFAYPALSHRTFTLQSDSLQIQCKPATSSCNITIKASFEQIYESDVPNAETPISCDDTRVYIYNDRIECRRFNAAMRTSAGKYVVAPCTTFFVVPLPLQQRHMKAPPAPAGQDGVKFRPHFQPHISWRVYRISKWSLKSLMQALSFTDTPAIEYSTPTPSLTPIPAPPPPTPSLTPIPAPPPLKYVKYAKMRAMRVPAVIIRSQMRTDGLSKAAQEAFFAPTSKNCPAVSKTPAGRQTGNSKAMHLELHGKLQSGLAARMSQQVMKANTLLPRNGQAIKRLRGRSVGVGSIVCSEPYELYEASRPGWCLVLSYVCIREFTGSQLIFTCAYNVSVCYVLWSIYRTHSPTS